jgi:hypothetical protein
MHTISGIPFEPVGSGMGDRAMYHHRTAGGTEYTLIESSDGRSVKHVIQQAGGGWSEVHDSAQAAVAAMLARERGISQTA